MWYFGLESTDIPLTISGWSGNIGQWDNRVFEGEVAEISYSIRNDLLRIDPAYVRDQRVAWYASHRHLPYEDTLYEYGYLFAYRLEDPEGDQHHPSGFSIRTHYGHERGRRKSRGSRCSRHSKICTAIRHSWIAFPDLNTPEVNAEPSELGRIRPDGHPSSSPNRT